jgi:NADH dehydrogenase
MSANGVAEGGVSEYQTTKWRAEKVLKDSGLNYTIFRPSVIFGDSDGRMEFTKELAHIIRVAPVFPLFGNGRYQLDPVSVIDVATAFVQALQTPAAGHQTLHLGGGSPKTFIEIIQTIGKAIGINRIITISIPLPLILLIAALFGRFPFFPVTADQINMLKAGNICPELEYLDLFEINAIPFIPENLRYLKRK